MNDDIQFLKDFQSELKTQENDGQASPRYWSIMDYKWEVTEEGYEDRASLFFPDTCERVELDEYVKDVLSGEIEHYLDEEQLEELKEMQESGWYSTNEFVDFIKEHIDDDCYFIYEKEVSFIAWNTLFFTKTEAKQHLENNRHHYSDKAHTFAMTAWRAPKMERLMKILETFDWDKVMSQFD